MGDSADTFDDHVAWLKSIRSQYEQLIEDSSPSPVGGATSSTGLARAPMPWAPTTWAEQPHSPSAQEYESRIESTIDSRFGALALEPDEQPVYRFLSMDAFEESMEVSLDDEPVYRCFDMSTGNSEPEPEPALYGPSLTHPANAPSAAETKWLQTMPPLLKRQNACIVW